MVQHRAEREVELGIARPLGRKQMRKNSWIWIAAGWFFVVRVSEYYALRIDLGHELTWEGTLRYTFVELGFWLIMTPVMAGWAEKFPLERPAVFKNVAVLLLLNVVTELLYSSYRVRLHHFVYPFLGTAYLLLLRRGSPGFREKKNSIRREDRRHSPRDKGCPQISTARAGAH